MATVPVYRGPVTKGKELAKKRRKAMLDYNAIIVTKPGKKYGTVKPYSHYNDPIDTSPGRPAGNSRVWGDASIEVQKRVIDSLIAKARGKGLMIREIAHVLAIARVESGFNPDAAAGTTSASSLGQFIDSTGKQYGLNEGNRFDVDANADALVRHYLENKTLAEKRGFAGREKEEMIYKYHHDGPNGEFGGLKISREEVIPLV